MGNPCGLTDPFSLAEKLAINVAGLVVTTGGPGRAKRGKGPVAAVPGPSGAV